MGLGHIMRKVKSCKLVCPKCGRVETIYRRKSRSRPKGHKKPLWCFVCQQRTEHTELTPKEVMERAYQGRGPGEALEEG